MPKAVGISVPCQRCGATINIKILPELVVELARRMGLEGAEMIARWSAAPLMEPVEEDRIGASPGSAGRELLLRCASGDVLSFNVRPGPPLPPAVIGSSRPAAWGMRRLGPGVWKVSPSLSEGKVHVVLTIVEVPEPAPWEKTELE